jgi:hypothetical protein
MLLAALRHNAGFQPALAQSAKWGVTCFGAKSVNLPSLQTDLLELRFGSQTSLQQKALPGASSSFIEAATDHLNNQYPANLRNIVQKDGYLLIFSPTLAAAYQDQGVYDPLVSVAEKQNPVGTLGVTYVDDHDPSLKFIVLADKPDLAPGGQPYSRLLLDKTINHEVSHAVVNATGLDKDGEILKLLQQDVDDINRQNKLKQLSPNEQHIAMFYFFGPQAANPVDEILADSIAWQCPGGGMYGGKSILNVDNPNLMKTLFPRVTEKIRQRFFPSA